MTTLTRRRRSAESEPDEETAPRRRRRHPSDDMPDEERLEPPRRSRRSRDEDEGDERPARRSRRSSRSRDDDNEDESPRRSKGRRSGRASGGFGSYKNKRRSNSKFADEFKPSKDDTPTPFKLLDAEPFDIYNQHWIEEGDAAGKTRHSFVCYDDEDYFDDAEELGCPLCDVGDNPSTYALWNVLNLENPRKPVVEVWKTSTSITDKLERMAESKRTQPLNRVDLYFELTRVKKGRNTKYELETLKAEDFEEEYEVDAFSEQELEEFSQDLYDDRTAITQVDSHDDLLDLAESLD